MCECSKESYTTGRQCTSCVKGAFYTTGRTITDPDLCQACNCEAAGTINGNMTCDTVGDAFIYKQKKLKSTSI